MIPETYMGSVPNSSQDKGYRPVWTEPNLLAVTLMYDQLPRLAEVSELMSCLMETDVLTFIWYTLINVRDERSVLLHQ